MTREVEVLLIEDNEGDAEMTIRALSKSNLASKLMHLKDGAEALDFLFSEGDHDGDPFPKVPHLILLDLKMPRVGGIEVLQRIKSDPRTASVPIVILTSSQEEFDVKGCYGLGANSYIVKPVEFDKFHKAISEIGFYWMNVNERSNS